MRGTMIAFGGSWDGERIDVVEGAYHGTRVPVAKRVIVPPADRYADAHGPDHYEQIPVEWYKVFKLRVHGRDYEFLVPVEMEDEAAFTALKERLS